MEDEIRVPIYFMAGFLESGKSTFLDFTIAQDYFQIDGPIPSDTLRRGRSGI